MSRLFISHSSVNNAAALALAKWLAEQGFSDVFLDVDPQHGLAPGERWQEALKVAADRCEAVLFLVSPSWLASRWCLAEFLLAKSLHKRIFGLIVEPVPLDRLPPEMTAEWQLCELVGPDRFRSFDVEIGAKHEQIEFREAGLDLLRRGLERAGLDSESFPWPPPEDRGRAPYRGLRALGSEDAAIFFGRDAAIVRGLDRVRGLVEDSVEKFLVVLGASGSGKSSFLRAGLWPRLLRDDLTFLPLPVIRPETAVITSASGLAAALAGAFERLGNPRPPGRVKEVLASGAVGLAGLLDDLVSLQQRRLVAVEETGAEPVIVIAIDQAEELFNTEGSDETAAFLDMLVPLLTGSGPKLQRRMLVVATMRSDRYDRLQTEPRLAGLKQDLLNLPPIPSTEFKTVIEGPARRVVEAGGQLVVEPDLTEQLIADARGADALPLLAFTLERLYSDYGSEGRLTLAQYRRIGGVQGSIEAAVAAALAEPGRSPNIPAAKEVQLASLRMAFIPWLARINAESGTPIRRVARIEEIPLGSRAVVERLVAVRLLVADHQAGVDTIEVAHESFLRQWPVLASWLNADAADLKVVEGVEQAAGEWARNGRREAWLDHRAERLASAERVASREDFHKRLDGDGAAYLIACRARETTEREAKEAALAREQAQITRTRRFQRLASWTLAILAVVVVVFLVLAGWQYRANLAAQDSLSRARADLAAEQIESNRRQVELNRGTANLVAEFAMSAFAGNNLDSGLRLAAYASELNSQLPAGASEASLAPWALSTAVWQSNWRLLINTPEGRAHTVAFSPDGSRLLTANGKAQIWDATNGRQIMVLDGATSFAAYSPDGTHIVTGADNGIIHLFDSATGKETMTLQGSNQAMRCAAFSPDGKQLVIADSDGALHVWDVSTGKAIGVMSPHDLPESVAFSPDGKHIAVGLSNDTAQIWDVASGKQIAALTGHNQPVESIAFSPNGERILTASWDGTARIWDAGNNKQLMVLNPGGNLEAAIFSPDGSRVATASWDKTVRIFDAETGDEIKVLYGHEDVVDAIAFSADGARLVSGSWDSTVRVWDVAAPREIRVAEGRKNIVSYVAFSPDGTRILATTNIDAAILDNASGDKLTDLDSGHATSAAFSPEGKRVVVADNDKTVGVWDALVGKRIASLIGHQDSVNSAVFSPDGTRILTASDDKTARVWDASSGKQVTVLGTFGDAVESATYSTDGKRVVVALDDSTARIVDASNGQEIAVLRGHSDGVTSAAFSPDGKRIVTASNDKTARIWDAATAREIVVLRGHTDTLSYAAFSADGHRVVTAGDSTVRIWDAETGKEVATLRQEFIGHNAALSPDETRLVSASLAAIRFWDVRFVTMPSQGLVAEICERRLPGHSKLTRDEMRLAGHSDDTALIDVCAKGGGAASR